MKINLEDCDLAVQQFLAMLEKKGNIIIYNNGKPCCFIGEIDDFQEEVLSLSQNQEFIDYLAQCRQRSKTEGSLSFSEIQRRLESLDNTE
ncbi:MAG TPA: hypothetical protein IGS17_09205 [Oscillatoriales cyanobacterium M59_W2019_021]|nr:hypothetical protein [Oscillatoriales cyanobacterium M4454_W2019_049]HIK51085.1 hypothetical protein [Oscillatoriales cyanobacterium M59_W2019_021]